MKLRTFVVLLLIPQIAFAGYFRGPDSIHPAATRAIFPLLPAASGESTHRRAARPSIIDETPDARTGQGEAQAAQARLDNEYTTFANARSAEQPGGWGLPREQEYDEVGNITLKDQGSFRQVPEGSGWRDDNVIREQTYKSTYQYDAPQPHAPSLIEERLPAESLDFPRAFTYDASGNQIESLYRGSDRRQITWNEDDQVKTVVKNGQELNRTLYDAQGQKSVHLHRVSGMEETAYLGPHLTIRDGRYLTKHVFVGGERVASKMDPDWFQEPPTLYFHTDHLGSANYVTGDRQNLIQHDEYMPSGELWQNSTDSRYELARRFLFTGKELDIHTGLYDFGARSYDPRQGQWLSPDPAFDGLNLYGYVHNNPINLVDPFGLSAESGTWTAHKIYDAPFADVTDTASGNREIVFGDAELRGPGKDVLAQEARSADARAESYVRSRSNEGMQQLRNEPISVVDTSETWRTAAEITHLAAPTGGALGAIGSRLFSWSKRLVQGAKAAGGAGKILSNQAAGKIIGWPTGQSAAGRTADMVRNLTAEQVATMQAQGLNRATVESLRGTYRKAIEAGGAKLRNEQLLPRAQLMDRILELWPK